MFPSFKKMLHQASGGSVKHVKAKNPLSGSKFDKTNFHRVDQENRHVSDWTQLDNSIGTVLTIHVLPTKPACYSDEKMALWKYSLLVLYATIRAHLTKSVRIHFPIKSFNYYFRFQYQPQKSIKYNFLKYNLTSANSNLYW